MARCDLRWKVACGFPLDHGGFDPSTLVYWRRRLAKSARPHRVNDAVTKVIGQTGVLTGRRRRAMDSTIVADAVATQDTVTQLVSAIRRVAREAPGAAERIAVVCTGHDYSAPGKPKIDWDDPAAKDALVSALVNDANALVASFKDADLEDGAPRWWRCWPWSPGRMSSSWAAQPALRENYRKHRPNVERVLSQVVSRGGRRLKLRYRGTTRNNAWLKNRTAALNLRNLLSRGLAFSNGAWILA